MSAPTTPDTLAAHPAISGAPPQRAAAMRYQAARLNNTSAILHRMTMRDKTPDQDALLLVELSEAVAVLLHHTAAEIERGA